MALDVKYEESRPVSAHPKGRAMFAQLRPALVLLAALTLVTGVAYPLLITGIAQAAFPRQANGSLIVKDGKPVGSSLIGQPFDDVKYFWSRPSGTAPAYNAASSTGTNLGPTNPALTDAVRQRILALRAADPDAHGPVPVDLVTASGSGLDPHISPAAALYQLPRVARARGLDVQQVSSLIAEHTDLPQLGLFGEPGVNVLELNLALDALKK
jgi:K+-transporting ATPase ATPase C chain